MEAPQPYAGAHDPVAQAEKIDKAFKVALEGQHPQSARFHELTRMMDEMHDRKQADYGRTERPFANIEASEEWGVEPWVGSMIRLNDKVRRLQKPATGGTLANEGILDSLMDIAVYALIAYVLVEMPTPVDPQ